jgi:hypothetical protein
MSFDLSNGAPEFRPLTSDIQVQWETSSTKIPAKQDYTFHYRATCAKAPCWFVVFSTMTGSRPRNVAFDPNDPSGGIVISFRLPTSVYVYGHTPVKPSDIKLSWQGNELHLQNTSAQCARVKKVEAHMKDGRVLKLNAFPVLPDGVRGAQHTLKFPEKPDYVLIHFRKFTIDTRH